MVTNLEKLGKSEFLGRNFFLNLLKLRFGKIVFSVYIHENSRLPQTSLHGILESWGGSPNSSRVIAFSGLTAPFALNFSTYAMIRPRISSLPLKMRHFSFAGYFLRSARTPPITPRIKPISQPLPTKILSNEKIKMITPPVASIPL